MIYAGTSFVWLQTTACVESTPPFESTPHISQPAGASGLPGACLSLGEAEGQRASPFGQTYFKSLLASLLPASQ